MVGRYLTPETIRLGLSALAAASVVGLAWRAAGRVRWGAVPFAVAALVAAEVTGRADLPRWDAMSAVAAVVTLMAGIGAARFLADPGLPWGWVATGALISVAGVWAGVPETGPAVLGAGGVAGLAATAALVRSQWGPSAGFGLAALMGWATLSGANGRPWATIGGALCAGVAPWFAFRPYLPRFSRSRSAGPWLLVVHGVLVILAARWIGVVPDAGWGRVAAVAAIGLTVAMATRCRP